MAEDPGPSDVVFTVGERFATFSQLEEKIIKYSAANCVQLWKRDSRTIEAAKKRVGVIATKMPEALKYYQVRYCCIHGGMKFVSSTKGMRKSSTFKQDCTFSIYIAASREGTHLEVRSINLEHNHPIAAELFRHLPQQRRLPPDLQEKARNLLKLKANKVMVSQEMENDSGNAVLLKDLSNIAAKGKAAKPRNDLPEVVRLLTEKHKSTVRLLADENNELQGVFFQDDQMRKSFQDCPEVLFIDATYKLLETRMACFLVIIENGNGESEIVAVGLFTAEDGGTLRWFFETFKVLNPSWQAIRITMADKDIKERSVVKEVFLSSALHICAFHTLQAFRREVSMQKLGITKGEQETALHILQRMVYASNQEAYLELYASLQTSAATAVVEYFNTNWHSIHQEWVMGMKWECGNFFNSTNNRAESMNSKLKQLVERFSSLGMFVDKFFTIIFAQRNEKKRRAAFMLQKRRVVRNEDEASELYSRLLTPYAYDCVRPELAASTAVNTTDLLSDATTFGATVGQCTCAFRKAMLLPCRHIFAIRNSSSLAKFEKTLCAERWYLDRYVQNCGMTSSDECNEEPVQVTSHRSEIILSGHQKFGKAAAVASRLADIASESSTAKFRRRLNVLETILEHWNSGKEVTVTVAMQSEQCNAPDICPNFSNECALSGQEVQYASVQNQQTSETLNVACKNAEAERQVACLPDEDYSLVCTDLEPRAVLDSAGTSDYQKQAGQVTDTLKLIKVPTPMRKCGRPKGQAMTVIGLPRKRRRIDRERPFQQITVQEKKLKVLTWLTGTQNAAEAMKGKVLDEDSVEQRPECIHSAIRDDCVDINLVRHCFTADGWKAVKMVTKIKNDEEWKCSECDTNLDDDDSVRCDWCLSWSHLPCVGLKNQPKARFWKCRVCSSTTAGQ